MTGARPTKGELRIQAHRFSEIFLCAKGVGGCGGSFQCISEATQVDIVSLGIVRRFVVKDQRHTVAGWNRDQTMSRFGFTKLLGPADNLIEELKQASLLIHHQLGVTDNVDEEHI